MDPSQEGTGLAEAANLAQIRSYRLNIWMVVLAVIQILIAVLSIWRPQSIGGKFMLSAWLPIILLLLSAAITMAALVIVSKQGLHTKRLAKLQQANAAKVDSLLEEKQKLGEELSRRDSGNKALQRQPGEGQETIKHLTESHKLERTTILLEKNMLEDKLKEAQESLRQANLRTNEEVNQRNNWMDSYYEASRKLADLQYVVKILEGQEKELQKHVVILRDFKVRVDLIDTSFGPPRIRFGFKIRNEALPNITIHEKGVGGKVYFRDHPLTETCRFDPNFASNVENIEHKAEGGLYLDQKLTAAEVDRINKARECNPNAEFSFEHVTIKVSGGDNFPYEATEPLHIPGDYQRVKLEDCHFNSNTENP